MKIIYYILVIIFLQSCSFDNKSGIWKNSSEEEKKVNKNFKDFKKIVLESENFFNRTVELDKEFNFSLSSLSIPNKWNDFFYGNNNVNANFAYSDKNELIFQSTKLSRKNIDSNILFDSNLLLSSDSQGNIILYSLKKKKILYKYNFYKKKYNKFKKKLYYILKDGLLYVSDNIGYLYVYNYLENNIVWAKKFDAPFRSNLKIYNNKLFLADENNNLFIINSTNGNILRKIPSEEILVKNNFVNNISLNKNNLFFLNTFGSLYSIDVNSLKVNWFINVNSSIESNLEKLFYSNEIKVLKNNLIITTNNILQVLDSDNGSTKFKIPINSQIPPIVNSDYIFIVTKNNYLISIQISTGKIIYSYEINQLISNFLKSKKSEINIRLIRLINNQLFIFLENAFVAKLSIDGAIQDIFKLQKKMNSNPIFIENSLIYLNNKNKIIVLN
jgi:outer membrane protein assembly factor BamB